MYGQKCAFLTVPYIPHSVSNHIMCTVGYDHPCTVHVEVFVTGSDSRIAMFSLDLVSPVEYLFRKLSLDDSSE